MAAAHQNHPQMEAFADTPSVVNIINCTSITKDFSTPSSPDPTDFILLDDHNNIVIDDDLGYNNLVINNDDDDGHNNLDVHQAFDDNQAFFDSFPPGYRFCPLDSELIVCYLERKIKGQPLPRNQIAEINLYEYNPDVLSGTYPSVGENQWYFFTPREKKYLNGSRPNRAAGTGYWKATGADKKIKSRPNNDTVGFRKALVFYEGRPPKGKKTNWIMHEFRVLKHHKSKSADDMRLDDYVLCKIYQKNNKSFKTRERDDDENPDDEPVQQDEIRNGNGSSYDPSATGNKQAEYPYAYQANYTHPSLESGLQYPTSGQVHTNTQPPSMGDSIISDIAKFSTTNFTRQAFLHGARPVGNFMHPAVYPSSPIDAVDAQGYEYLKEEITVVPNPGGQNIAAQDNLDLPMDSSPVDHYLDLGQCFSCGFENPSMPQVPEDSSIDRH